MSNCANLEKEKTTELAIGEEIEQQGALSLSSLLFTELGVYPTEAPRTGLLTSSSSIDLGAQIRRLQLHSRVQ